MTRHFQIAVLVTLCLLLAACGGGSAAGPAAGGGSGVSLAQSGTQTAMNAGSPAVTLTAAVANATAGAGVSWSIAPASGCGTIAANGLKATYKPPAASALDNDCSAVITATSKADGTQTASITFSLQAVAIVLPAGEPVTATTAAKAVGIPLAATIANDATGHATPQWKVNSCGSLSPSTGTSVTYKPPAQGPCKATVTVAPSTNAKISQAFTITVNPALTITTATLPAGSSGVGYAGASLAATGGIPPYTWAVAGSGSLPPGLVLGADGTLSGTPSTGGGFHFDVTVTDSNPRQPYTATQSFSVPIGEAPAITSDDQTAFTLGTAGSFQVTASGYPAPTFTASGPLPSGVKFSSSGRLQGTPATAGAFPITITASNGTGASATQHFTLSVGDAIAVTLTSALGNQTAINAGSPAVKLTASVANGFGSGVRWSLNPTSGCGTLTHTGLAATYTPPTESALAANCSATVTVTSTADSTKSADITWPIQAVTIGALTSRSTTAIGEATIQLTASIENDASGNATPKWKVSSHCGSGSSEDKLSAYTGSPVNYEPPSTLAAPCTARITVAPSTNSKVSQTILIEVNPALALKATLPVATAGTPYSVALATGGVPPYTWVLSGSLPAGLALTADGLLSGTPSASGASQFTVTVTDNLGVTQSKSNLSLNVNPEQGATVSGTVTLVNGGTPLSGVTIDIGGNGQDFQGTTDGNGSFQIVIPKGTWTLTPSLASASSSFYPASTAIAANHDGSFNITSDGVDPISGVNFTAALAYAVSGTVDYNTGGGANLKGLIFLTLTNTTCGACASFGTSISSPTSYPGSFTINGVAPGTYKLQAWMDIFGYGVQNIDDPTGSSTVTVSGADISTAKVTLSNFSALTSNPPPLTQIAGPVITNVSPMEQGVILQYQPVTSAKGIETAVQYNLQWSSSSSTCTSSTNQMTVTAGSGSLIILDGQNANDTGNTSVVGAFTDGDVDYFCMQGVEADASTGGKWSTVFGPVTIGPPAGTNTLFVTVDAPAWVTLTGPLYTGCYDPSSYAIYATSDETPLSGPYSVSVPDGISCQLFAVVDQNNDGSVTAAYDGVYGSSGSEGGDIFTTGAPPAPVTISSAAPASLAQNLDLSAWAENAIAAVTTEHQKINNVDSYNLNFSVREGVDQPVAVTLQPATGSSLTVAGPNVISPTDVPLCATCAGPGQFAISLSTGGIRPQADDAYNLYVSYIDLDFEDIPVTVSGVVDDFATIIAPRGTAANDTPTFTWSDPSSTSTYVYQFTLRDANGNTIWQIPAAGVSSNGFPGSVTSITFGTDPTGNTSNTLKSLTSGTYSWTIGVVDSHGNTAVTSASFTAP